VNGRAGISPVMAIRLEKAGCRLLVENMVLLVVAHTVREEGQDEVIRLISARRAMRKERKPL
jgi:uncharacterized DUF497 family protein